MLIQSSLPSSIKAAACTFSDNGKQDFLYDMPGPETWQNCAKCDIQPESSRRKASLITDENKIDNSSPLSIGSSSSVLLATGSMPEHSAPNYVYRRRKLRKSSVAMFSAQASTNTQISGHCLHAASSEVSPLVANSIPSVSQAGFVINTARAHILPTVICNVDPLVTKSESIDGCSVCELYNSDQIQEYNIHKSNEFGFVNDSCLPSKSNMELDSASMEAEVDCAGECSYSGALTKKVQREDLLEKDVCISILRSEGLLGNFSPIGINASENIGTSTDDSCSRSCKFCGIVEVPWKMLICDYCEGVYHLSCCSPHLKKIPVDEWLCQSCLKNKHQMLREKTAIISRNTSSGQGHAKAAKCKGELSPIASMLSDMGPYTTGVRIGNVFQADVPDWSGSVYNMSDLIGEALVMDASVCINLHTLTINKPSRFSSIGNWLQCRELIKGMGQGVDGTVCGKWRRAPIFEVQTDKWDCFHSVHWDPNYADCAVPQELETDEVFRQLKYIEMLRPRLAAKRKNMGHTKTNGCLQDSAKDEKDVHKK